MLCVVRYKSLLGADRSSRAVVCCGCCVLSGRVLCDELIARPEELSVVGVVCCQVEVPATADHSSRGVLATVVRRCV